MEVASPLTFGHVQPGSKRRFAACSPLDTPAHAHVDDFAMDESAAFQSFKRRRCDNVDTIHSASSSSTPFGQSSPFGSPQQLHAGPASIGNKRQRHYEEAQDATHKHLRTMIDRQNAEIRKLRNEKETIENSYKELSIASEKTQNENKVLKKVLAIKQERQEQFVSELENARRYKEQAEQLIAVLRQHLHAQQSHGNTGVGFHNGGPPNVY